MNRLAPYARTALWALILGTCGCARGSFFLHDPEPAPTVLAETSEPDSESAASANLTDTHASTENLLSIAEMLERQGQIERAKRIYELILSRLPDQPAAKQGLERMAAREAQKAAEQEQKRLASRPAPDTSFQLTSVRTDSRAPRTDPAGPRPANDLSPPSTRPLESSSLASTDPPPSRTINRTVVRAPQTGRPGSADDASSIRLRGLVGDAQGNRSALLDLGYEVLAVREADRVPIDTTRGTVLVEVVEIGRNYVVLAGSEVGEILVR